MRITNNILAQTIFNEGGLDFLQSEFDRNIYRLIFKWYLFTVTFI